MPETYQSQTTFAPVARDSVVEVWRRSFSFLPTASCFGKIRDLSLGGCCVDTAMPMECGARAEIVVHVNSASFRAVGEVRGIRGDSEAGIEFVYLSRGGKDLLADLIAELARLQALIHQLKSARREAEMSRSARTGGRETSGGDVERAAAFFWRDLCLRRVRKRMQVSSAGGDPSKEAQPLVIPVSLFS